MLIPFVSPPQILSVPRSLHHPTIKAAAGGGREGALTDSMGLFLGPHARGSAAKTPSPTPKSSRPILAGPRELEKASGQMVWLIVPTVQFICCVTLGRSLHFSRISSFMPSGGCSRTVVLKVRSRDPEALSRNPQGQNYFHNITKT